MRRLLICGFGPFPEAPDNPSALAVAQLQAEGWAPPGAQAAFAVLPTVWDKAPEAAAQAARTAGSDSVLLTGVAVRASAFRVETLARNRASQVHADAEGQLWPSATIDPLGPPTRPVTAPTQAICETLTAQDLPAALSADAGDYLCNFTLYRLLGLVPATAFLHVPQIGQRFSLDDITAAIRAVAATFAARGS
jgi:pyroglutamyl-peptidase